ncbi:hypothetical protein [uncultured Arthrobacter sp.]|uniref:hypothetical protein n=1 Tax=uncultured Arthrobacter sp. TaxID=114050 RepID=UPI00321728BF
MDVAAPVLGINDQDTAGTDQDVVEVGFLPSRPMNVMKREPTMSLQLGHSFRDSGLACCADRPCMCIALRLFEFPSQTLYAFCGQPRLLGSPVSCSHVVPQLAMVCRAAAIGADVRQPA